MILIFNALFCIDAESSEKYLVVSPALIEENPHYHKLKLILTSLLLHKLVFLLKYNELLNGTLEFGEEMTKKIVEECTYFDEELKQMNLDHLVSLKLRDLMDISANNFKYEPEGRYEAKFSH